MIRSGHMRLDRSFNLCCRYTDDLNILNNSKFSDYVSEIYTSQLTTEKANKSDHLASCLNLPFKINSVVNIPPAFTTNVLIAHCQFSIPFQQHKDTSEKRSSESKKLIDRVQKN